MLNSFCFISFLFLLLFSIWLVFISLMVPIQIDSCFYRFVLFGVYFRFQHRDREMNTEFNFMRFSVRRETEFDVWVALWFIYSTRRALRLIECTILNKLTLNGNEIGFNLFLLHYII